MFLSVMGVTEAQRPFAIEQFCLMACGIVLTVLFILQIISEQHQGYPFEHTNVRWRLHRVGLLAAAAGIIQNIDPWSIFGLYTNDVAPMFTANISALLLAALVFLFQATVVVLYRSDMKEPPKWVDISAWFTIISLFLACNISLGVAIGARKWWIVSYWLIWVSMVMIYLTAAYVGFSIYLLVIMYRSEKRVESSLSRTKLWTQGRLLIILKAAAFLALAIAVVPSQIQEADIRLAAKKDYHSWTNFSRGYDPSSRLFTYTMWIFMVIVLWASWIPLKFSDYALLKQREDEHRQSVNDAKSRTASRGSRSNFNRKSSQSTSQGGRASVTGDIDIDVADEENAHRQSVQRSGSESKT